QSGSSAAGNPSPIRRTRWSCCWPCCRSSVLAQLDHWAADGDLCAALDLDLRAALELEARAGLHFGIRAGLELDVSPGLDLDIHIGLEGELLLGPHDHLVVAADAHLTLLLVPLDHQLPVARLDGNLGCLVVVDEDETVALA